MNREDGKLRRLQCGIGKSRPLGAAAAGTFENIRPFGERETETSR